MPALPPAPGNDGKLVETGPGPPSPDPGGNKLVSDDESVWHPDMDTVEQV